MRNTEYQNNEAEIYWEMVEGIHLAGTEKGLMQWAFEFLNAFGQEIEMMKQRVLSGDKVALGYAEVLTRAIR